jgi:hypothetical protein
MIEILLLFIATGSIASFARGRGASPTVWGATAAVGYLLMAWLIAPLTMRALHISEPIVPMLAALAWIGGIAVYVRFGIGAGKPAPDSQWACSECNYMNGRHAIICEACQKPWPGALA